MRAILGDAALALGIELIGESYVVSGDVLGWVMDAVREIEARRPDAIVNLIQGEANLAFIHRLRARGITPAQIPTLSCCFTEFDLRYILKEMAGDYLCGHYDQSLPTPENARFLARLALDPRIGANPVVSGAMVAAYAGVQLWARAVERGGQRALDDLSAVRTAMTAVTLSGPGGPVKIDPVVQCDAKYARVAQVEREREIAIVWSSPAPIPPIAYPATRTRDEWDKLILSLREALGRTVVESFCARHRGRRWMRAVKLIDAVPITIIDGSSPIGRGFSEYRWPLLYRYRVSLVRAPHSCIAYAARSWNHPAILSRVTSCKAEPNASWTVSFVRAAADLIAPLTFENISSIGVMSGLHGGNGTTSAPAASTASSDSCGLRLSQITTSPGFNSGARTSAT